MNENKLREMIEEILEYLRLRLGTYFQDPLEVVEDLKKRRFCLVKVRRKVGSKNSGLGPLQISFRLGVSNRGECQILLAVKAVLHQRGDGKRYIRMIVWDDESWDEEKLEVVRGVLRGYKPRDKSLSDVGVVLKYPVD